MTDSGLTDAQRALVEGKGDSWIMACPGAGKTRAIVGRYVRRTGEERRKGIALISFTKVAAEEVRKRCGKQREALEAPNFVGTFDSFINRFLTTPLYARRYGRPLNYVEAWDQIPAGVMNAKQHRISLELFDYDQYGNAVFCPSRVRDLFKAELIREVDNQRTRLTNWAMRQRKRLFEDKCLASSSASRWFARNELKRPETSALVSRLIGARFAEVIVDEAQDCGVDELAILEFLQDAGVALTLVADRDQSIYEFRDAAPQQLGAFVKRLERGKMLDGNFRSAPAICALNDSLRSGAELEKSVGRHSGISTPVRLVEYKELTECPRLIRAALADEGLTDNDVVVLAHAGNDASRAAGAAKVSGFGQEKVIQVAEASRIIRARKSSPRARADAIATVERLLLERIETDEQTTGALDEVCEYFGIERRWLRDAAMRTIMAADVDQGGRDRAQYSARLQAVVGALQLPSNCTVKPVSRYLRTPNVDQWAKLGRPSEQMSLVSASIHAVKGQEFPAVALVIPKTSNNTRDADGLVAVDHWEAGTDAEGRRVLYVGASRAEMLVILAVHRSHYARVRKILQRDAVPFT